MSLLCRGFGLATEASGDGMSSPIRFRPPGLRGLVPASVHCIVQDDTSAALRESNRGWRSGPEHKFHSMTRFKDVAGWCAGRHAGSSSPVARDGRTPRFTPLLRPPHHLPPRPLAGRGRGLAASGRGEVGDCISSPGSPPHPPSPPPGGGEGEAISASAFLWSFRGRLCLALDCGAIVRTAA